jgi:hypothetical protein
VRVAFTGHEPLTFTDYIDLGTGKTLTASPGGVYDVAPASGRDVPDIPGQWFAPVKPPAKKEVKAAKAPEGSGPEASQ